MITRFTGSSYLTPEHSSTFIGRTIPNTAFYLSAMTTIVSEGLKGMVMSYTGADWVRASVRIVRALERIGVRISVEGIDNFTSLEGPCVFIGNHMSTLETFVLPSIIQPYKDVTFVVKQSLVSYPFFKHVLLARDPIVVGRVNPREDLAAVLNGGVERLNSGRSIIIFPQSTRSDRLDPKLFNSIGIKLAKKAGVPVVPVALKTDAWGAGKCIKDVGPMSPATPVNFAFGPSFMVDGNDKEAHANVFAYIESHLTRWSGENSLPPPQASAYQE